MATLVLGPAHPDYGRAEAPARAVCARNGCGITFTVDPRRLPPKRFCSVRCAAIHFGEARRVVRPAMPEPEPRMRTCARSDCGATFTMRPHANKQRYCSPACEKLARFGEPKPKRVAWRETRACAGCGQTFVATSAAKDQRYCAPGCVTRKVGRP